MEYPVFEALRAKLLEEAKAPAPKPEEAEYEAPPERF